MKERTARRWIGGAFTAVTLGWLLLVLLTPVALARDIVGRTAALAAAGTYLIGGVVCHQRLDRSFHPHGVQMPVCARCAGLYLGAGLGVLAAAGFRRRGVGRGAGAPERLWGRAGRPGETRAGGPGSHRPGAAVGTGPPPTNREDDMGSHRPGAAVGTNPPPTNRDGDVGSHRPGAAGGGNGWAPAWLRWAVLAAAAPTGITFAAEMAGWMPSIGELRAAAGVPLGVAVTWVASLVIRGELA